MARLRSVAVSAGQLVSHESQPANCRQPGQWAGRERRCKLDATGNTFAQSQSICASLLVPNGSFLRELTGSPTIRLWGKGAADTFRQAARLCTAASLVFTCAGTRQVAALWRRAKVLWKVGAPPTVGDHTGDVKVRSFTATVDEQSGD